MYLIFLLLYTFYSLYVFGVSFNHANQVIWTLNWIERIKSDRVTLQFLLNQEQQQNQNQLFELPNIDMNMYQAFIRQSLQYQPSRAPFLLCAWENPISDLKCGQSAVSFSDDTKF